MNNTAVRHWGVVKHKKLSGVPIEISFGTF